VTALCHHPVVARQASADVQAAILRRVRAIPPGFVRTYGDVSPGAPRLAGYVLANTEPSDAPWHRVVRADGSLAKGARQRRLLEAEGVPFRDKRVLLSSARLDDLDVPSVGIDGEMGDPGFEPGTSSYQGRPVCAVDGAECRMNTEDS
jgi:methylated-DNA-protein-cysteine methyltransferase related protein